MTHEEFKNRVKLLAVRGPYMNVEDVFLMLAYRLRPDGGPAHSSIRRIYFSGGGARRTFIALDRALTAMEAEAEAERQKEGERQFER